MKTDFGAAGNGQNDDSPALQAALNALAQAGGGTLLVPPGRYALATPVAQNFFNRASSVTIRGVGSASQFIIKSGNGTNNIRIDGPERFVLSNLVFTGTPDVSTDATIALSIYTCNQAIIEHCDFYGVSSVDTPGGSIVYSYNTNLRIRSSSFRGCAGNAALGNPVVYSDNWIGLSISDTDFIDYGTLNGIVRSKTAFALTYAWVLVGNPLKFDNAMGQGRVHLQNVRMDEGAWRGFACIPGSERVGQILLSGVRINVCSADLGIGIYINKADQVTIEQCGLGFNSYARSAIYLEDAGNVTIHSVQAANGMNSGKLSLNADAWTRVTVVNSAFDSIVSTPEKTLVLRDWSEGFQLAAAAAAAADASATSTRTAPMKAPTGPNDAMGSVGDMTWDENYVYVKTSTGWKRTALGSW